MADVHNIPRQKIISKSRSWPVVEARAVIALLATDYTRHTLNDVAAYLGREISTMSKHVTNLREKIFKFAAVQEKIRLIEEIKTIRQ
jgi:chromosomal replication initiation ATPase DnaA